MLDLLIRGGEVVTSQGVGKWSVGVQGEKIAFIGTDEHAPQAGRTIDASGKIVVPGGIEPHAHLDIYDLTNPDAGVSTLGPEEDTRGMAFGGTTTHLDFCCHPSPEWISPRGSKRGAARWKGQSYVDYSFHVGLLGALPLSVFDQIGDVIKQGFPSFKVFTTDVMPPHPKRVRVRLDMGRVQLAMEKVAKHDGIMVVHAEDDDLVQFNYERFAAEGRTEGWNMNLVHTKLSEELAFDARSSAWPARAGPESISCILRRAKAWRRWPRRAGDDLPIYCETLHHYACFSADDYKTAARLLLSHLSFAERTRRQQGAVGRTD